MWSRHSSTGGAHALSGRGLGASQYAPNAPRRDNLNQSGGEEHQKQKGDSEWKTIVEDLTKIKKGLIEEGEKAREYVDAIDRVITRVSHALKGSGEVEKRLGRIEAILG